MDTVAPGLIAADESAHLDELIRLDALTTELRSVEHSMHSALGLSLDDVPDHAHAAMTVRKLRFIEKLSEEIRAARESMEH
jgi:molecular chaperone HscB